MYIDMVYLRYIYIYSYILTFGALGSPCSARCTVISISISIHTHTHTHIYISIYINIYIYIYKEVYIYTFFLTFVALGSPCSALCTGSVTQPKK